MGCADWEAGDYPHRKQLEGEHDSGIRFHSLR
jgi:hypothetical protein